MDVYSIVQSMCVCVYVHSNCTGIPLFMHYSDTYIDDLLTLKADMAAPSQQQFQISCREERRSLAEIPALSEARVSLQARLGHEVRSLGLSVKGGPDSAACYPTNKNTHSSPHTAMPARFSDQQHSQVTRVFLVQVTGRGAIASTRCSMLPIVV